MFIRQRQSQYCFSDHRPRNCRQQGCRRFGTHASQAAFLKTSPRLYKGVGRGDPFIGTRRGHTARQITQSPSVGQLYCNSAPRSALPNTRFFVKREAFARKQELRMFHEDTSTGTSDGYLFSISALVGGHTNISEHAHHTWACR